MKKPIKMLIKQANVQANRERNEFAKTLRITGVQMSVIDFLSNQADNSAFQHDIEQELDIRRSTTTVLIQRMEKNDLVKRVVAPTDKRKKKVQLTSKARGLVGQIKEYVKNDDLELLSHFSEEEIQNTVKVLEFIKTGGNNG